MAASWRPMTPHDVAAVMAIAEIVHPGFPERTEVMAEKYALSPQGSFMLQMDETPIGYVLSHPYRLGAIPKLDVLLGGLPEEANCFYVHDMALLEQARGQGLADVGVRHVAAAARSDGFEMLALCAIAPSVGFWQGQGFASASYPGMARDLRDYGEGARYMTRKA